MGLFDRLFGSKKSKPTQDKKRDPLEEWKIVNQTTKNNSKGVSGSNAKNENSVQKSKSTSLKDFILNQFKVYGVDVEMVKSEYLEPSLEELLQNNYQKSAYDRDPAAYRDKYFLLYGISHLVYHHPKSEILEGILDYFFKEGNPHYEIKDLIKSRYNQGLSQHPEKRDVIYTATSILRVYHALYIKKDQNFSYANEVHSYINNARNSVNETDFEKLLDVATRTVTFEAPRVLLHLLIYRQYDFESKSVTTFDDKIELVSSKLQDILDEFNDSFKKNLKLQDLKLIGEHIAFVDKTEAYLESDYKDRKKVGIKEINGFESFLTAAKKNMPSFMDAWVYYGSFYFPAAQSKLFKEITANLLSSYNASAHDFDNWLSARPYTTFTSNEHNKSFYTPLFEAYLKKGDFSDYATRTFESYFYSLYGRIMGKTLPKKITSGLSKIADQNPNTLEREFKKLIYKSPVSVGNLNHPSQGLYTGSKNTREAGVLAIHSQFSAYVPSSVKSVNKGQLYEEGAELFVLNIDGQDYEIPNSLTGPLNKILEERKAGVRIVPVPVATTDNYYGNKTYISTLCLLNLSQFKYLTEQYLPSYFLELRNASSFQNVTYLNTEAEALHEVKEGDIFEDEGMIFTAGFANDVKWQWFKEAYIDKLKSKEKWYKVMDVLTAFTGTKKPSKKWISDMNEVIEEMGEQQYFDELGSLIYESREEKSWFFDQYNKTLKGMIWSCSLRSTERSLLIIKTITELSYTKIPGVGPRSTKTGNFALEALANSPSEVAYGILQLMRMKSKYPRFVRAIDKFIEKYKANNEGNIEELEDKALPDFGIKDGVKTYNFGDAVLEISFSNGKIVKTYIVNGKRQKKIPDVLKQNHEARLKEVTAEIKQINDVFKGLKERIKSYWLFNRSWKFADWQKYIYNHPLMNPLIENLVWMGVDSDELFISKKEGLVQTNGAVIELDDKEEVRLWHPIMADSTELNELQQYFKKNKLKQLENQIDREFYKFSDTELKDNKTERFANKEVEVRKLMALANSSGWIFTYVHEDVSWPRMYLKEMDITAHFKCDYDRNAQFIPTKELFFSKGNTTKIAYNTEFDTIKLSEVPETTLSEICRDVDMFVSVAAAEKVN